MAKYHMNKNSIAASLSSTGKVNYYKVLPKPGIHQQMMRRRLLQRQRANQTKRMFGKKTGNMDFGEFTTLD